MRRAGENFSKTSTLLICSLVSGVGRVFRWNELNLRQDSSPVSDFGAHVGLLDPSRLLCSPGLHPSSSSMRCCGENVVLESDASKG